MCTATRKPTTHSEPIYFVGLESTPAGTLLVTNTQSERDMTGDDGFPVQYRQTINLQTGACICDCQGFQQSIAWKASRASEVPTVHNGRTCKHIRRAHECGAVS